MRDIDWARRQLPAKVTDRALIQLDTQTMLRGRSAQATGDLQAVKVDAVAQVAQRAMQCVAFTSQVEQQLGQVVPLSVTRLQAIGDLAALAMGEIITDTVTKLRHL